MAGENISHGFRLKYICQTKKYLIQETNWNELTSEKHKTVCATLNYV